MWIFAFGFQKLFIVFGEKIGVSYRCHIHLVEHAFSYHTFWLSKIKAADEATISLKMMKRFALEIKNIKVHSDG